eukprot:4506677-Pyramimonas_sp.AAC.2
MTSFVFTGPPVPLTPRVRTTPGNPIPPELCGRLYPAPTIPRLNSERAAVQCRCPRACAEQRCDLRSRRQPEAGAKEAFTGAEAVRASLICPGGGVVELPCTFKHGRWQAAALWTQVGEHTVTAFVNGVQVDHSPLTMKVVNGAHDFTLDGMSVEELKTVRTPEF